MNRLLQSREHIKTGPQLAEYRARMAGHLEGALALITIAADDALQNLEKNPGCAHTAAVVEAMARASGLLVPLVEKLAPLTAPSKEAADG